MANSSLSFGTASFEQPLGSGGTGHSAARVWVVDDSPLQREMSRRALAPRYDVTLFSDGPALLERLELEPAPNVLVLDWHMPELSGIEVCRHVRKTRDAAALPILMLSAMGTSDTLLEALDAGVNDYVEIPFSEPELNARIFGLARISALRAQLAQAEARLRLEAEFRERFMGMLAHDLRQPLNSIALANHILSRTGISAAETEKFLAMQLRSTERMQRMITELLDFTRNRPESGLPLEREPTNWATLAEATLEEIGPSHPDRQFELTVEGSCVGYWDPDRLTQLCGNLIENAVEHGAAHGPIEVQLLAESAHVELRVSNPGAPLPAETLATLFQPFRRALDKRHTSQGVGLGLHIVQQIAEAHGGTATADSDSLSTTFCVRLPRGEPSEPLHDRAADPAPPSGPRGQAGPF